MEMTFRWYGSKFDTVTLEPVSYTHLDVYKRQIHNHTRA